MTPCFAIIDTNTLSGMALRNILWDMFNYVEIHTYSNVEDFIRDSNRHSSISSSVQTSSSVILTSSRH